MTSSFHGSTSSPFHGQVTFTCTRPNLKVQILRDLLRAAVPEIAQFPPDSDAERIFDNLASFLGRTTAITFQLVEPPAPDLAALRDFWGVAQGGDYRAIWDAFILLNLDVHNAWMEALNDSIPDVLAAPKELQPDTPDAPDSDLPNAKRRRASSSMKSTPLSAT